MGFYGNLSNSSKTTFTFDRIYSSRSAMESKTHTDGVYVGRYVLVEYDSDFGSDINQKAVAIDISEKNKDQYVLYATTDKAYPLIYQTDATVTSTGQSVYGIYPGDIVYYEVLDSSNKVTGLRFFLCVKEDGKEDIYPYYTAGDTASFVEINNEAIKSLTSLEDLTQSVQYAINYAIDQKFADEYLSGVIGRGWDSTVWQKVYSNGVEKYVMIAELNSVVPTFDLTVDAPQEDPVSPHFDETKSNVYYKMHLAPSLGFRVHSQDFTDIDLDKADTFTLDNLPATTDDGFYPSDFIVPVVKKYYANKPSWDDEGCETSQSYSPDYPYLLYKYFDSEEVNGIEDRWYTTKYHFDKAYITEENYKKGVYYTEQTDTSLPSEEDFDSEKIYYTRRIHGVNGAIYVNKAGFDPGKITYSNKNISDAIQVVPTGVSGQLYNTHSGTTADKTVAPDIEELSMMLPSVGDSIAKVWNIIYGDEDLNGGDIRNLDIEWEDASKPQLDREGLRLEPTVVGNDGYTYTSYKPENSNTIAGCINSVHDILGMIVDAESLKNNPAEFDNSDWIKQNLEEDKIYYYNEKFYRKKRYFYTKDLILNKDYEYKSVGKLKESEFNPHSYFTKDGDSYEPAKTYNSNVEYWVKTLIMGENNAITLDEFAPNTYYYKDLNDNYIIDTNSEATNGRQYYTLTMSDKLSLDQDFEVGKYFRRSEVTGYSGQYNYLLDESAQPGVSYYSVVESSSLSKPFYQKDKYYYKDTDSEGNEVLVLDDNIRKTADRTYYLLEKVTTTTQAPSNYTPYEDLDEDTYNKYSGQWYIADEDSPFGYSPISEYQGTEITYYRGTQIKTYTTIKYETVEQSGLQDFDTEKTYYTYDSSKGYTWVNITNINGDNTVTYYAITWSDGNAGFYNPGSYYYTQSNEKNNSVYNYILGNEPEKLEDKDYYKLISFELVNREIDDITEEHENLKVFYVRNKFYLYNEITELYTVSEDVYNSSLTYYYPKIVFVENDELGVYAIYSKWNNNVINIPNTITLCTLVEKYHLVKIEDFARNLGTVNGMILKMLQLLEYNDEQERNYDDITVRGTINELQDIVDKFAKLTPGNVLVVDEYGRAHGAEQTTTQAYHYKNEGTNDEGDLDTSEDRFIYWNVNEDAATPEITIEHNFTSQPDTTTGSDKNIAFTDSNLPTGYTKTGLNNTIDDTIQLYTPIVDNMGHVVGKNTETVVLPFGFKNLKAQNSSDDENKWSQASGATASTNEHVRDIIADNTKDSVTFAGGNKWIRFQTSPANDAAAADTNSLSTELDTDNILTIAHETHDITTTKIADTDLNNPATDTITVQDTEFDIAGHVTANQKHTYTLPYGFKVIKVTNDNKTVKDAASTINANGQIADNTQDTLTFSASNKWIKLDNNTEDTIKIGHGVNPIDTTENATSNMNTESGAKDEKNIDIPDWSYDEAGHITSKKSHTYTLPFGFKTIVTNGRASNNNTTNLDTQSNIVADTTQDTLSIYSGNEWIKITTDADNDKITISHDVKKTDKTPTSTQDLSTETSGSTTFETVTYSFDDTNHFSSLNTKTLTMPNSYGKFTGDTGSSEATATHDAFAINGDTWVVTTAETDKIGFAHSNPHKTEHTVIDSVTPEFGKSFIITDWDFDDKGHKANSGTHTVTIPQGSLTDATKNGADVITQLSFTASTGALSTTRANVGSLLLTDYALGSDAVIAATDTVNGAFGKLQAQIQAMDLSDTEDATKIISTITETDGKVTFSRAAAGTLLVAGTKGNGNESLNSIKDRVDTLTSGNTTEGSVAYQIAQVVAGADASYDTLKEIADWILSDDTGAAKMNSDISTLQTEVEATTTGLLDRTTALEGKDCMAITSTDISNWNTAYTNNHTHSNKSTLDEITDAKVTNWDSAYSDSHTHSNKTVLDGITSEKVSAWDEAEPNDENTVLTTTTFDYTYDGTTTQKTINELMTYIASLEARIAALETV